jgi:hypothetical protein
MSQFTWIIIAFLGFIVLSCSGRIYFFVSPNYELKKSDDHSTVLIDTSSYYLRMDIVESKFKQFEGFKFNTNEVEMYWQISDSIQNIKIEMIEPTRANFCIEKNIVKWKVREGFLNGFRLYRAEIYYDSLILWQFPRNDRKLTYIKSKNMKDFLENFTL